MRQSFEATTCTVWDATVLPLDKFYLASRKAAVNTAVKVGVPNLETDLFTNVNKLCPSCNT